MNIAEIAAGVSVEVGVPGDAVAGDTLEVDTDGDGAPDHTIVLTDADIGSTLTLVVDPTHVPSNGTLTVTSTVTSAEGTSPAGTASSTADSSAPGAPTVTIGDGGDGALGADELAGDVTVDIEVPADEVAGGTLHVDTDGDGEDDHTITLTEENIGGVITIIVDAADIPDSNGTLTVTASVTDAAGNTGSDGGDSSTTGSLSGAGGCVAYDMADLPVTLPSGAQLLAYAGPGPFAGSLPSSGGCSTVPTGAARGFAGVGQDAVLTFDAPVTELYILQFHDQAGDDLTITPSATITSAGCGSYYHVVLDAPSATVTVSDIDAGGGSGYSFMLAHCSDETAPSPPTVSIDDGQDGYLNAGEIAGGVTADIGVPDDAGAGDTLGVDSDGDGAADQTQALTDADTGALIVVTIDPAHVPAEGTLTVSATITDSSGNASAPGSDTTIIDTTGADEPTVEILDGGDGVLSAAEQSAVVNVSIGVPATAGAGDTLNLDTDGDESADEAVIIGAADIGSTLEFAVDSNHLPPAFETLTVTAWVVDVAGNVGPAGADTSQIGCTPISEVDACCSGADDTCDDGNPNTKDSCDEVTFECTNTVIDGGGGDTDPDADVGGSDDTGSPRTDTGSSTGTDASGSGADAEGEHVGGDVQEDSTGGEDSGGCSTGHDNNPAPMGLMVLLLLGLIRLRRLA